MTGTEPPAVVAYLRELDVAGSKLPRSVQTSLRARVVRELVAKVDTGSGQASPAEVTAALNELGEPADLVAAERKRYGLPADPLRPRDIATVYLLAAGPFLFGIGAVIGFVLLWTSPRWPLRQRAVATALFAVGAVVTVAVLVLAVPALHVAVALFVGGLAAGPWASATYLAALRMGRRIRASKYVERQGVE